MRITKHSFAIFIVWIFIQWTTCSISAQEAGDTLVTRDNSTSDESNLLYLGYQKQEINDLSDLTTVMTTNDFNKGFIISPWELIMGRIPGLIISNEGAPGKDPSVINMWSLNFLSSSVPLVIIDGVPMIGTPICMNPYDIENITFSNNGVVNGMYGAEALNGVLVINTKKGTESLKVNYSGKFAIATIQKKYDLFTAEELRNFITTHYADNPDAVNNLGASDTDWQKEVFRVAVGTDHNLSFSGKVTNIPVRFSVGKVLQNGIIKNSSFDRTSTSIRIDPSFFEDQLIIGFSAIGIISKENLIDEMVVYNTIVFDPTRPVYTNSEKYDGFFEWTDFPNSAHNPLALLEQNEMHNISKNWIGNFNISYKPQFMPNLTLDFRYSGNKYSKSFSSRTDTSSITSYYSGHIIDENNSIINQNIDFTGSYAADIPHLSTEISIIGGYFERFTVTEYEYDSRDINGPGFQKSIQSSERHRKGWFGNVSLNVRNKYFLDFGLRNDKGDFLALKGINKMSTPFISLAWKVKNENFLKEIRNLSDLKFRIGYDNCLRSFPVHSTTGGINTTDYSEWETRETYMAGLDFALTKSNIKGNISFTERLSNKMELQAIIPSPGGWSYGYWHIGSLKTYGLDFSLKADLVTGKDFHLRIMVNSSLVKTKVLGLSVLDYYNFEYPVEDGVFAWKIVSTKVDEPINSFYVYQQVCDEKGNPVTGEYYDRNHNGEVTSEDMYFTGHVSPEILTGISVYMDYRNWEFKVSSRLSQGNFLYDYEKAKNLNPIYQNGYYRNTYKRLSESLIYTPRSPDDFYSDYYLEKASFFRVDNISLGYSFKDLFRDKVSIMLSVVVQNAFVITGYEGYDPEVATGISNFRYPRPRTFSFNIDFNF